ncbi:MAG: cell division control protein Ccd6 [Archaeoglobaceae archaeon]
MVIFRDASVFDPDFIPEFVKFRDRQIEELKNCVQPILHGLSPLNALCTSPPATGKTLTVKLVTSEVKSAFVRCLKYRDPFLIYSKIFRDFLGVEPPSGGKSRATIINKVWERLDSSAVIVLDDLNFLKPRYASEILYEILKAPEEWGVKVGVIAVSTDRSYVLQLDPFASAIFHYLEIRYPPYSREEIREILAWRVEHGFESGAISDEAFEKVVEITSRSSDLRYGIHLLRAAAILASRDGKIKVEHVERAHAGDSTAYLEKLLSALNSDERAVLRIIYSFNEISTGELFEILHGEVRMSYRRFYDILEKLERLRLIDVLFGEKGRGKTRYVYPRFERELVEKVLKAHP